MKYQEIEVESMLGLQKHIIIDKGDGSFTSFPAENKNPNYISFLRQLSEENPNDPHYLEWVEAGNDPEDFWSQSEDFLETSVSEVTEPKEETPQEGEV